MKKIWFLLVVILLFFACKNTKVEDKEVDMKDSTVNKISDKTPKLEPLDKKTEVPFFIISVSSTNDKYTAAEEVVKLRETYEDVNYLWIPDYKSLSGKELYSVFLGTYTYLPTAMAELMKFKKTNKDAYGVEVSQTNKRLLLIDKYDIRVDDKKLKIIIGYADPKVEENYFAEGGEDWTWFVDDVATFYKEHYENEVYFCYMPEWIPLDELKKMVKDINGDSETMGYILIDGKNKNFLQHNMSGEIISESCDFFKLDDLTGDM